MMIEHVDAIVDMRRFVALEKGGLPANAQGVLESLRNTDTVGGFALEDRANWSIDLDLPIAQPGQSVDILFCQANRLTNCATKKLCAWWLSF